jgi:serine/threonine-protein kinase SRPK3
VIPTVQALREEEFLQKLGEPKTGNVQRKDGQPLRPGVPRYLVNPTSYPLDVKSSLRGSIKIVDFGQSFLSDECPGVLNTPLPVRAPEIIFKDKVDHRVDLWSMACLVSLAPWTQCLGMH